MIVTDDTDLYALCWSLRNQGRPEVGPWLQHERLGFNYPDDELSAALGRVLNPPSRHFLASAPTFLPSCTPNVSIGCELPWSETTSR